MNRDPMTAGGTQDGRTEDPQSKGENTNNISADAQTSASSATVQSGDNNATQSSTVGTGTMSGEVISYDESALANETNTNPMADVVASSTPISSPMENTIDTAGSSNSIDYTNQMSNPSPADNTIPAPQAGVLDETNNPATVTNPNVMEDNVSAQPTPSVGTENGSLNSSLGNSSTIGPDQTSSESTSGDLAQQPTDSTQLTTGPSAAVVSELAHLNEKLEPTPQSAAQPGQPNQPDPATANSPFAASAAQQSKGKHKGLIIVSVVLGVLVLAVAGLLIWFFAFYNKPEKVAFDAVSKLVSAKELAPSGVVSVSIGDESTNIIKNARLLLGSSSVKAPSSTNATLQFDLVLENTPSEELGGMSVDEYYSQMGLQSGQVSISLGTVQMEDGVIYFRVAGIKDSMEAVGIEEDGPIFAEMSQLFDVIDLVDEEWWRISIPELVDKLEKDYAMGSQSAEAYKEFYACMVNVSKTDYSHELKQNYSDHPFVNLDTISRQDFVDTAQAGNAAGSNGLNVYYRASLDHTELANFLNQLTNGEMANAVYDCYNQASTKAGVSNDQMSAEDLDEVSADDISETLPNNLELYLEISSIGHQLKAMNVRTSSDEDAYTKYMITAELNFEYHSSPVTEPEKYRPATELIDELSNIFASEISYLNGSGDVGNSEGEVEGTVYIDTDGAVVCEDGSTRQSLSECPEWQST